MGKVLYFYFYHWHLLTPLNLQWSFSALHNDKVLWSLSVLSLFRLKRAWSGQLPSIILKSWPHGGCSSRRFTTGLVEPISSAGPYQPHDGRGRGKSLLINWPDGTETPQMGKNNDSRCEKADPVSQLQKFSRCTCIQTARLNQSELRRLITTLMIHRSGRNLAWLHWLPLPGGQCSLSISTF